MLPKRSTYCTLFLSFAGGICNHIVILTIKLCLLTLDHSKSVFFIEISTTLQEAHKLPGEKNCYTVELLHIELHIEKGLANIL